MNIFRALLSGVSEEISPYLNSVILDGGGVTDVPYLRNRVQHAKDNGYYNNIKYWVSPSFGIKTDSGYVSKLYDVIHPDTNSLISIVGSEQPLLIQGQNNKLALRGDGLDDSLYTTHSNPILEKNKEYVVLFIFSPITHQLQASRSYYQTKESSTSSNLVQSTVNLNYNFGLVNINGSNGQISISRISGINNTSFCILGGNFRNKGAYTLNDTIGNYFLNCKNTSDDLQGLSLFGGYYTNITTFINSKTNFDFYELMIIDSNSISYELLHNIKQQANQYYNKYTPFEFTVTGRLLNGISDLDGVFSLFNRVAGYSGACIRLRRSSDNTEQDFGFISDFIDLNSIISFAGGSNLFVRTWYDQSEISNYNQSTNSQQFQFFVTGGGDDLLQPYIKAISSNNTNMTRTSNLTSADIFKCYNVFKKNTDTCVIWVSGASSNYINLGISGGVYSINKMVSGSSYIKRSSSYWDANGEQSDMVINCFGNIANTPSKNDLILDIQTREDLASDVGQHIFGSNNTMTIGGGVSSNYYNGEIYETFVIRNITHNQKTLENNLVRIYQQLP